MIYMSVAMYCEAKPIIDALGLKKIPDITRYQIFKSSSVTVIITGVGGTNAMMAIMFLLTKFEAKKTDCLVSFGISAAYESASNFEDIYGEIYQIKKITNSYNNRDFYPDLITSTNMKNTNLLTVPFVYHNQKELHQYSDISNSKSMSDNIINTSPLCENLLIDMESAFVYEAACTFIYSHNIFILKIVSDNGVTKSLDKDKISSLIAAKKDVIIGLTDKLLQIDVIEKNKFEDNSKCIKKYKFQDDNESIEFSKEKTNNNKEKYKKEKIDSNEINAGMQDNLDGCVSIVKHTSDEKDKEKDDEKYKEKYKEKEKEKGEEKVSRSNICASEKIASQFNVNDQKLLENAINRLRLTNYQITELINLSYNAILRGKNFVEIFENQIIPEIKIKKEGKIIYEQLRKHLLEP